ncbi:MAG: condensation domain-containing protein, partial [Bacteroidota bacterium]
NHFTVYTPKPKALSVQYKDYVEWSNKSISAESLEKQKNYWVETLKDASGEVTFKPDHSRPDVMTVEGKTHTFVVDPETRKKLEDFCTQYNVSPFMFFYAIWLITVYKNTGKTDVLIGSPVANREHPDLENMAGLFMNMIVLRAAYDSTDQFVNMLQKIKQVVSNGLDNGSYPFDNLLYDLDVVTEK